MGKNSSPLTVATRESLHRHTEEMGLIGCDYMIYIFKNNSILDKFKDKISHKNGKLIINDKEISVITE